MDIQIKMPDLATTAEEVTIVRWLVEVGTAVRLGEPLLEIETDKATMDVEAVAGGVLKAILANAGDQVAVGQVIAIVESASQVRQPIAESSLAIPVQTTPTAAPLPTKAASSTSLFARNKEAHERKKSADCCGTPSSCWLLPKLSRRLIGCAIGLRMGGSCVEPLRQSV